MGDDIPPYNKGDLIRSYYIPFDATGVPAIDAVLHRVARAGKQSHHTEGWGDPWGHDKSLPTPLDLIQQAGDAAAAHIATLEADRQHSLGCEHSVDPPYRCSVELCYRQWQADRIEALEAAMQKAIVHLEGHDGNLAGYAYIILRRSLEASDE